MPHRSNNRVQMDSQGKRKCSGLPHTVTMAVARAAASLPKGKRSIALHFDSSDVVVHRWLDTSSNRHLPADALPDIIEMLPHAERTRVLQALLPDGFEATPTGDIELEGSFWAEMMRLRRAEGEFAGDLVSAIEDNRITPDEASDLLDRARGAKLCWDRIILHLEGVAEYKAPAIVGVGA